MQTSFKDKVALITGGTSGIGRATAVAFAREGAKVVVTGRRQAEGEETLRLVRDAGGDGLFLQSDITKEADAAAMVARAEEQFGRLDFAFNNAGVEQLPTPITETTDAVYDRVMDTNVRGVVYSLKYEIPALRKSGGGVIVNTSSIAGLIGMAGIPIYIAAKHAVNGLTKAVALEVAKENIRVNAICPAAIETEMFNRFATNEGFREHMASLHPVGRFGQPEEIAAAVLYLCSPLSGFLTGVILPIDGGWTAQ